MSRALLHPDSLRDLRTALPGVDLVLIGGGALAWWGLKRTTDDLDLAVGVGPTELLERMSAPSAWSRVPSMEHRWKHRGGALVDLIPCGPSEIASGELCWLESGGQMSVVGFRHVFAWASRGGELAGLEIGVADRATLALLKIVAWLDRPHLRRHDLGDLAWLFDHYLEPLEDRLFVGPAAERGIYGEAACTWLLGHDLGRRADTVERACVDRFVAAALNDGDPRSAATRMARDAPPSWRGDVDAVLERMGIFKEGWEAGAASIGPS